MLLAYDIERMNLLNHLVVKGNDIVRLDISGLILLQQ